MKMYQIMIGSVVLATAATVSVCWAQSPASDQPAAASESKPAATQAVYVCPDCHTVAMKDGKCAMCGKTLAEKHVLSVKDGKLMLCDCAPGCACTAAGVKDGKCSCGKKVQEMSAKGMYVCACAGGKCCTMISDKPGNCACGEPMKKVE